MSNYKDICTEYEGLKSDLISVLQDVQDVDGYISKEAITEIAKFLRIHESSVYGVVTF